MKDTTSKVTPAQAASGKGSQGTATKARKPRVTLDERITMALHTYGKSDVALKNIGPAWEAAQTATAAVVEWVAIAQQWEKSGKSGREWGRKCGGSAMTFGRLLDTGALILASRKGKGTRTLTPREAVKVANVSTRAHVADLCARMAKGEDPLGLKATAAGDHSPSKGKGSRRARVESVTLTPDKYVTALEMILANVSKVSRPASVVEIARLAHEIDKAYTARAAGLATPKGRKATATPAVTMSEPKAS